MGFEMCYKTEEDLFNFDYNKINTFSLKLEMTELNLKQLRSASNDDFPVSGSDQIDQNKEQDSNNSSANISNKEHDSSLQKENDDLHTRIEELTLYIQQATQGWYFQYLISI